MDGIEDEAASVAATVAAIDAASMQRIEIVGERRRAHDAAFRARVVAECMVLGTRVQELAPAWHLHQPDLSMAACGRTAGRRGVGGSACAGAGERTAASRGASRAGPTGSRSPTQWTDRDRAERWRAGSR